VQHSATAWLRVEGWGLRVGGFQCSTSRDFNSVQHSATAWLRVQDLVCRIYTACNLAKLPVSPSHRIDPVPPNAHRPQANNQHDGHHDDGDCLPRSLCPEAVLRRGLFGLFLLFPLGFLFLCFLLLRTVTSCVRIASCSHHR
jgi:hypothetical protein